MKMDRAASAAQEVAESEGVETLNTSIIDDTRLMEETDELKKQLEEWGRKVSVLEDMVDNKVGIISIGGSICFYGFDDVWSLVEACREETPLVPNAFGGFMDL